MTYPTITAGTSASLVDSDVQYLHIGQFDIALKRIRSMPARHAQTALAR